ncbi:hypothetical protein GGR57DRAFT_451378 [Xylariaceae sp. FL1272]|nr:hypothetical protein GGR57DRAFT_451378 [Xylariaceae sp. FL1272]
MVQRRAIAQIILLACILLMNSSTDYSFLVTGGHSQTMLYMVEGSTLGGEQPHAPLPTVARLQGRLDQENRQIASYLQLPLAAKHA